jgi:hypothetical protein
MTKIGCVVLGVRDMGRATEFWSGALRYTPRAGEQSDRWTTLEPAADDGVAVGLQLSESPVPEHPRVHLDLHVSNAAEQRAEVERLTGLGAGRVDWDRYPDDPDFVVLADTEGNRFCVVNVNHPA